MQKEFQIQEPCNANRENMHKISGGSFCDLCSKKVYDLTDRTDEEIHSLIQSNESICGRIQAQRLYFPEEKEKSNYNFFQFPFRKVASGIFLSILFTSNFYAQKSPKDTLDRQPVIEGLIISAPKYNDEYRSKRDNFKPVIIKKLEVLPSGNKEIVNQYYFISILTPSKIFKSYYSNRNYIDIPSNYIRLKNIFVFEGSQEHHTELNENKYFLFVNKKQIKEDSRIELNLDHAKKIDYQPKNKELLYFLDGEEILKDEYEQSKKEGTIKSYFLPELYAKELFGDEYNLENGVVLSYRK